jgi:hypothetical protein
MSLPIIDSPIPLELNEMWSSYMYIVEGFGEDDPEIEKLFHDLYGMTRSSNDSKMIPNEFLELIYERHPYTSEDTNKLYGLIHSLYEYWEIERTFYKSLRKLEKIVSKEFDREFFSFYSTKHVSEDTEEYPIEMLKKIFKVNVKELV